MNPRPGLGFLVTLCALTALNLDRAAAQCQLQKLGVPGGQSSESFGRFVSMDHDVAIVGWPWYVFHRVGGSWIQIQQLLPPQGRAAGSASLASVSGDIVLLGAFVFRRQGNTWIQETVLADPTGGGSFGFNVAVSGDVALVGVPPWIFRYDGSEWVPEQELVQPDPPPVGFDAFGVYLALSGDVAVVTAFGRTETVATQGALYVYRRVGATWTMEQKLVASDPVVSDFLGSSVAIEGDVIVAGARRQLHCLIPEEYELCKPGAAYVFRHDGDTWVEEQKLVPSDGTRHDHFGDAVDISGDTIVVGAPYHGAEGLPRTGAAYVYHWDGTVWTERGKLIVSDPENLYAFGDALAISGDTAIIGDPYNEAAEPLSGAAYVFAVAGDCNANGQIDACEALTDPSLDINANLVLDQCENIPTVSQWGLTLSALLLVTAGSILIHRRRLA